MEPIDFDGIFEKKLAEYIRENAEKYTEREWENKIPSLYRKFGDTYLKSVGATPRGYYEKMSDEELVEELRLHVEKKVPVSDFLCREIEKRGLAKAIAPLLKSENEELVMLAVNLAGGDPVVFDEYFALLKSDADKEIKDAVVDQIKTNADFAKARALAFLNDGIETELMLEILSRTKERDDKVFETLLQAFREGEDPIMRASYLAAYGDNRALPALTERIDREDIDFLEFRELKYAIETLGGEYTRERDFSDDPYYREILSESQYFPELPHEKN